MRSLALVTLVAALALPAESQDLWVGKKVFPKSPDAKTTVGGREVDPFPELPALVIAVQGDRLEVVSGGRRSHVPKTDVVILEDAVAHFTALLRTNPTNTVALNLRGTAYQEKREFDPAIKDFCEAIRLQPNDSTAYYNRGNAYSAKGELDRAVDDYTQAIKIEPKFPLPYVARGNARFKVQEYDLAIADYTRAIQVFPQDSVTYRNRGIAWSRKNEVDKAIADFTEAVRHDPNNLLAYLNRGDSFASKNDYAKAASDYTSALRLDPDNQGTLMSLAWLLATCPDARVRDGKKAVELARRLCQLSQWKEAGFLDILAAACAEAGDSRRPLTGRRRPPSWRPTNRNPISDSELSFTRSACHIGRRKSGHRLAKTI
jgi:tetratricopeptide (TPR) repeat protein